MKPSIGDPGGGALQRLQLTYEEIIPFNGREPEAHLGPEALWERYTRAGYLGSLSFSDRRRFMTLVYQFMVALPLQAAGEIGEPVPNRSLLRLRYPSLYHPDIGLSMATSTAEPLSEQFI